MGNNQVKEEIIIKCEIGEMLKQFFKDSVIVWHDPNIDSPQNKPFIAQLENLCQVKTFTQFEEASAYIKEIKGTCHIITPEVRHAEEICKEPNVYGIYILGQNQENIPDNNSKVLCIEANIHNLLFKVEQNLMRNYQEKASSGFAFAPIFNEADKKKLDTLHMYLEVIPTFKDRLQAKNDFLTLCKVLYSDEKSFDFIISLSQNYDQYDQLTILNLFTTQSLFPRVLNACLRISSSDSLQYCRLPLQDMQRAICEYYHKKSKDFSGLLYKTAYIAEEDWENLKVNCNKEIETLGFFLTSKDLPSALNFMQIDPNKNTLITVLVPKGPTTEEYGFAEIEFAQNPLQVILNIKSRFTILEANEKYSQDLPYRHLVLLYGTQDFRKYLAEQNPAQSISLGNNKKISCDYCKAQVLEKSPNFYFKSLESQSYYCQECRHNLASISSTPFLCVPPVSDTTKKVVKMVKGCFLTYPQNSKIPFYGYPCSSCQENNYTAKMYFKCTKCHGKWCEKCIGGFENCLKAGHNVFMETFPLSFWYEKMSENELKDLQAEKENKPQENHLDRQADMFIKTQEYEKALDYYMKFLKVFEGKSKISLTGFEKEYVYQKIAKVYALKQEHRKSLEYYLEAYKTLQFLVENDTNPRIAPLLYKIGSTCYNLVEFSQAEEYFSKALMLSKLPKGNNPLELAPYYASLGSTYLRQGHFKKALEYLLKAFELSNNDPLYCSNLGLCYLTLGDNKKAEECCIQMLETIKSMTGDVQYQFAVCYSLFGDVYEQQGDYKKAEEYYLKSFEIREKNNTAESYSSNAMGRVYQRKGDYNKALELHFKALEYIRSLYGENHIFLRPPYNALALTYCQKGEYAKALEYCSKAHEISKSVLAENHPDFLEDYKTFGRVYEKKGDYNQALEHYLKVEEILKTFHGKNHPDMGECYCDLGNVYSHLEEYEKAVEFYFRALQMTEMVFEENKNHPNLANSYSGLGEIYHKKKEYKMAMDSHLKSLNIRKEIYGENHPDMAVCYFNIGDVYRGEGDDAKAKEYHLKALEIRKLMMGDNHPDTSAVQKKIEEMSQVKEEKKETEN